MADVAAQACNWKRTIENDLPCVRCRYNLRGLPPDGRCPECAVAVAASRRRHLWSAEPRWLSKVRWGLRILIVLQIAVTAQRLCTVVQNVCSGGLWDTWLSLAYRLWWLGELGYAVAGWFLTAPHPGGDDQRLGRFRIRRATRWLAILSPAMYPAFMFAHFLRVLPRWMYVVGPALMSGVSITVSLGMLLLITGFMNRARYARNSWLPRATLVATLASLGLEAVNDVTGRALIVAGRYPSAINEWLTGKGVACPALLTAVLWLFLLYEALRLLSVCIRRAKHAARPAVLSSLPLRHP
jgi:hypothetical protein